MDVAEDSRSSLFGGTLERILFHWRYRVNECSKRLYRLAMKDYHFRGSWINSTHRSTTEMRLETTLVRPCSQSL